MREGCIADRSIGRRSSPGLLQDAAGVPLAVSFFAKSYLLRAAVERPELVWLMVAAVLNSVISVYFHLRILVAKYFRDRAEPARGYPSIATGVVLVAPKNPRSPR
jgi:NADH:ubiquinone oxidoreductase subunit 2 (subunit N)